MPLQRRDWQFIAIIGSLLLLLMINLLRDKPPLTPGDAQHRSFLQALARGEGRAVVEKGCLDCHNQQQWPLPAQHPPKEQCLVCHGGQQ